MKAINKIFIKLIPVIILSSIGVASADTKYVTFSNPDKSHLMTLSVNYSLNDNKYNPGSYIYPTLKVDAIHITCSNGAINDSQKLYISNTNFDTGNPDLNRYIQINTINTPPNLYMDKTQTNIYLDGAPVYNLSGNVDYDGNSIVPGSIENAFVRNAGEVYASYRIYTSSTYDEYGNLTQAGEQTIPGKLAVVPALAPYSGSYIPVYIPSIYTVTTSDNPVKSGTTVYGSSYMPNNIRVPNNAVPGKYVAQVKMNPSWNTYVAPTEAINTGSWNSAYGMRNPKMPESSNMLLSILGIKTATAIMMYKQDMIEEGGGGGSGGTYTPPAPTPCTGGWWCDIQFFGVPLSQPFEIISSNTPPTIQVK